MREILFRGKMPVESKWAYGSLISEANVFDKRLVLTHIYDKDCNEILVDPKTVGQYTGLCDKNGTKIFEGDILEGDLEDNLDPGAKWRSVVVMGKFGWMADDMGLEKVSCKNCCYNSGECKNCLFEYSRDCPEYEKKMEDTT